jgi:hypothetical protein
LTFAYDRRSKPSEDVMRWRQATYQAHRWIGLVVSLQLLAWSLGGLYFSWFDMDVIRGAADARPAAPVALPLDRELVPPAAAIAAFHAAPESRGSADASPAAAGSHQSAAPTITSAELRVRADGRAVWSLAADGEVVALVDGETGAVLPRLDQAAAEAVAQADFAHQATVRRATLVQSDPPLEIRGRRLPVWRIELDHPRRPNLYVDAITGEVVARRNTLWRIFDFLWMLHIMDYRERENFHHPLLTTMSALAVLSSASGLVLWGFRLVRRRGRHVPA